MPEGPEILYFNIFLKKKLKNYKFEDIKSFTNKPIIVPKDWEGNILDIGCKGKLLWLYVSGKKINYYMHIHYGITGWLTFEKPNKNIKFEFFLINTTDKDKNLTLYMEDKRRFSKINIYIEEEHLKIINKLGIDLFSKDFTLENFKKIISSKNTFLAGLILKQDIICGIGNYIKNESLYMGRLNVKIKTFELTMNQIDKLYNDILFVGYSNLMEMLEKSKISKYLDKFKMTHIPQKLEIPYEYKIYGMDKTSDGHKVYKIKVAGRDSYCIKELC